MDSHAPTEPPLSFTEQISSDAYHELARQLRTTLPDPADPDIARRDRAAVAQIVGLVPANPAEANQAAHYVILSDVAMACLRRFQDVSRPDKDRSDAFNWATSLLRQSNAKLALLLRMQGERRKREATPKGAMQADAIEANVAASFAIAMGCEADPPPQPEPEPGPAPEPAADPVLTEAERYAVTYPKRAKLIRENRGMPDLPFPYSFGPPPQSVIDALLSETSRHILALDEA